MRSRGIRPEDAPLNSMQDIVAGLMAAGQWPDFGTWLDSRYPAVANDDPVGLLGKIL